MHLIYNIFNPQQSNARAACANAQGYVVGCITKGDDAQQTIAAFIEGVKSMKATFREDWEKLIRSLPTKSPVLLCYRNPSSNESYNWGGFYYKNLHERVGTYPENPYGIRSDMTAFLADMMLVRPELITEGDFLHSDRFNFVAGKDVIIMSTAAYEQQRDWETLRKTALQSVKALCGEHPDEQWEKAGEVLRTALGEDEAYIIFIDADECRQRVNWNVEEGVPTDKQLHISWRKKGWALMGHDYDEHTDETVQAHTGSLTYAGFIGLCITKITDTEIVLRKGDDERILTPGSSETYHYNDSYEDHEGVEQRDIDYWLHLTWVKE